MHEAMPRHNLPPRDYEQFVGRQKELADVHKLLLPYPKSRYHLVTIDGIGGIGKSALALETAYTFRDQYASLTEAERFEAIVWVSAKRTYLTADGILERRQAFRSLDDLYAAIAQVLDYPAITRARAEEQFAIVEEVLRQHRTLLILDNLETVDDEELLAFLHELPDPAKAIVTTRHRIDVARPVRLTGMQREDALELIEQEATRKDVGLSMEEQEGLWQRTGGVPLAIVWSIGLMGLGGSIESVLRRLGSGQSDIARFCFEESIAEIRGRDAYWLLLALALFASDASREALGVVAGLGEDEFGRDTGLEELLRLSLVNKEGDRFSLLPLTREYVGYEASSNIGWIEQAQERLQLYYFDFSKRFGGWTKSLAGHDNVEQELKNILSIIGYLNSTVRYKRDEDGRVNIEAASIPQARYILNFCAYVVPTCRMRGHLNEAEELCRTSIALAREIKDISRISWRSFDLGRIYYQRGDMKESRRWSLEACKDSHRLEDNESICHANRMLGLIALRTGDSEEAISYLSLAEEGYHQWKTDDALPYLMTVKGMLAEARGDLIQASQWFQKELDTLRDSTNVSYLASALLHLGRVEYLKANPSNAYSHYFESLRLAQEWKLIGVVAEVSYSIALLEFAENKYQAAKARTLEALDRFRRLGMKPEQAEAEALLAKIAQAGDAETQ